MPPLDREHLADFLSLLVGHPRTAPCGEAFILAGTTPVLAAATSNIPSGRIISFSPARLSAILPLSLLLSFAGVSQRHPFGAGFQGMSGNCPNYPQIQAHSSVTTYKEALISSFPKKMERGCLFAPVLLWLIFQGGKGAGGAPGENRAAATGPSTLLPPPENGMTLLPTQQNLLGRDVSDSAVQQLPSSASPLKGLGPISQPRVWKVSPQERLGVVQLFCQVPEGTVDTIEWKRGGKTVSVVNNHSLPTNFSLWIIPATEASHCGPYSCNASSVLGWKESPPLSLASPDVSAVLELSLQVSISALMFAVFCGWGMMLPICQPSKLRIRGQAWTWLSIYTNGTVCLASMLTLVAIVLWTYAQGFPALLIPPIILLIYVVLVTLLLLATLTFQMKVLYLHTDKSGQAQRMLGHAIPGGVILVAVTCALIIKDICQLQAKGCARPVNPTAAIAATSGLCMVPYMVISVRHFLDLQRQEVHERISRRQKWAELQDLMKESLQDQKPSSGSSPSEASSALP